jgi:hypothetical protein
MSRPHARPKHRISHTKSRNGCFACKNRRVKVLNDCCDSPFLQIKTDRNSVMKNDQYVVPAPSEEMNAPFQAYRGHVSSYGDNLLPVAL